MRKLRFGNINYKAFVIKVFHFPVPKRPVSLQGSGPECYHRAVSLKETSNPLKAPQGTSHSERTHRLRVPVGPAVIKPTPWQMAVRFLQKSRATQPEGSAHLRSQVSGLRSRVSGEASRDAPAAVCRVVVSANLCVVLRLCHSPARKGQLVKGERCGQVSFSRLRRPLLPHLHQRLPARQPRNRHERFCARAHALSHAHTRTQRHARKRASMEHSRTHRHMYGHAHTVARGF